MGKFSLVFKILIWFGSSLILEGCSGFEIPSSAFRPSLRIDGSSTVYPLSEAVVEDYGKVNPSSRIAVSISGTGGGFKRFLRGEVEILNASRPIQAAEVALARGNGVEFIEIPVAYDGVVVAVHPENDWCRSLTVEQLKRLWAPDAQGRILKWSQIRMEWPEEEIHLYGPGVDSGTYDYFTYALLGQEGASRGDYTASEDDNLLVRGVAGDRFALGFFSYAYYFENSSRLRLVRIDDSNLENEEGPVLPTPDTISAGFYQPLTRPVFIYVRRDAVENPDVRRLVEYYLENAGHLASEVGLVPYFSEAYVGLLEHFNRRRTGAVFGGKGSQVGLTVEQFLERGGS